MGQVRPPVGLFQVQGAKHKLQKNKRKKMAAVAQPMMMMMMMTAGS